MNNFSGAFEETASISEIQGQVAEVSGMNLHKLRELVQAMRASATKQLENGVQDPHEIHAAVCNEVGSVFTMILAQVIAKIAWLVIQRVIENWKKKHLGDSN